VSLFFRPFVFRQSASPLRVTALKLSLQNVTPEGLPNKRSELLFSLKQRLHSGKIRGFSGTKRHRFAQCKMGQKLRLKSQKKFPKN
jgi:hypothetical protein